MTPYSSLCDDFGVYTHLTTKMELPQNRETVLHFFDSLQKSFPRMTDFERRDEKEYVLEEYHDSGSYRWVSLDGRRLCSGFVNPPALEDVDQQNERLLEMAPYHLGVSGLDADSLDVLYYFDFLYAGNHDEVVAEALGGGGPLEPLVTLPGAKVLNYEPSVMLALDEGCRLQARLSVETRTNAYQVRTREYSDEQISVYFTVRQYWGTGPEQSFLDSLRRQREVGEEILQQSVIPRVVRPLAQVIASR